MIYMSSSAPTETPTIEPKPSTAPKELPPKRFTPPVEKPERHGPTRPQRDDDDFETCTMPKVLLLCSN